MLTEKEKREIKRAYKESQRDRDLDVGKAPTVREWYKKLIFDRFLPKKLSDLILPPRGLK